MAETLALKISADITDLTAKLAIAKSELSDLGSEMRKAAEAARVDPSSFGALAQVAEKYAAAKAQAAQYSAELKGGTAATSEFSGITAFLGGQLKGLIAPALAAIGIAKLAKDFLDAAEGAEEFALGAEKTAVTLGVSLPAATQLGEALKLIGVDSDFYTNALFKLERQLRTNEPAIRALGLATRDASGQFLSGQALMENAIRTLEQYKEGTDRNEAATVLFGRGASEVFNLYRLNTPVFKQAQADLEAMGVTMSGTDVAAAHAFEEASGSLSNRFHLLGVVIGREFLPYLTTLATQTSGAAPAFEILGTAVKGVATAFEGVVLAGKGIFAAMVAPIVAAVETWRFAATAISSGFDAALQQITNDTHAILGVITGEFTAFQERMNALWGGGGKGAAGGDQIPQGTKQYHDLADALKVVRAEIDAVNAAFEAQKAAAADAKEVNDSAYRARIAQLKDEMSLGQISASQELAAERRAAQDKADLEVEALLREKAAIQQRLETETDLYRKLLPIDAQYQAKVAELQQKAATDTAHVDAQITVAHNNQLAERFTDDEKYNQQLQQANQRLVADLKEIWQPFTSFFDSALGAMFDRTQKFSQQIERAWASLFARLTTMVAEFAAQYAAFEAAKNVGLGGLAKIISPFPNDQGQGGSAIGGLISAATGSGNSSLAAMLANTTALQENTAALLGNKASIGIGSFGNSGNAAVDQGGFLGLGSAADTDSAGGGFLTGLQSIFQQAQSGFSSIFSSLLSGIGSIFGGIGSGFGSLLNIIGLAEGSEMVTRGGLAFIHSGETVVPAASAGPFRTLLNSTGAGSFGGGGIAAALGGSGDVHLHLEGMQINVPGGAGYESPAAAGRFIAVSIAREIRNSNGQLRAALETVR